MPTADATIHTSDPSRYLTQLCRHASHLTGRIARMHAGMSQNRPEVRDVTWTDTDGTLQLSCGTCTLHAEPDQLTLHADADSDTDLQLVQDLITRDLERFGHREQLTITWQRA
jgi:hypothetical protein